MPFPSAQEIQFKEDIVPEPCSENDRIILWVRGEREGKIQQWERISNIPRVEVTTRDSVSATLATVIPMQQEIKGFFGKLTGGLRKSDSSWSLPGGEPVVQVGDVNDNYMLVWSESENPLNDEEIAKRWPTTKSCRQLGENLFLVSLAESNHKSVQSQRKQSSSTRGYDEEKPLEYAKENLQIAREKKDRKSEAQALIDIGILLLQDRDLRQALPALQQAMAIAQEIQERSLEYDALANLAEATLAQGQIRFAMEQFDQVLTYSREVGDRFTEKSMFAHFGNIFSQLREPIQSLEYYDQAIAIAREVGDKRDEANLLWISAAVQDDMNQKEDAITRAQQAVDYYQNVGDPKAKVLAEHLQKYRQGGAIPNTSPQNIGIPNQKGPSLFRMAITATASMAKFVASGFKTISKESRDKRLQTCNSCEYHTGVRCRLCGCWTSKKTWLPYEQCPIGKWPV